MADPLEVDRTNVELVVVRRVRLPFVWTTFLVFVLRADAVPLPAFAPLRWRRTVRALDDLGWPVVDGPGVGWREIGTISAR